MRAEGPSAGTRVLACVLMLTCVPGPVLAAPPGEDASDSAGSPPAEPSTALEWYARGIELAQAEDFLGAAAAFLRSHELKPTPEALFNAALAYETGGRPVEAITTYRRYLAEPEADPEQRSLAEASIDTLLREVAVIKGLRWDTERVPVEITIAGEVHDLDEFPLPLMPGEITVEVVDAEGAVGRETYTLAAGEALVLDIRALWPEPKVPQPEIVPNPPDVEPQPFRPDPSLVRRAKILRVSAWTGVGLTGAGLVAIGVAGGIAIDLHRREDALVCPTSDCDDNWPVDRPVLIEQMNTAKLIGNVAIGVTSVLAVTTLAVGIVAIRETRQARRGGQVKSATRMRVHLSGLEIAF